MRKTCRTCGADRIWGRCDIGFSEKNRQCWIPPKTPLLVDELTEALRMVLRQRNLLGRIELSLANEAQITTALARYQREVGDAPKD